VITKNIFFNKLLVLFPITAAAVITLSCVGIPDNSVTPIIETSSITSNSVSVHGAVYITDNSSLILMDFSYGLDSNAADTTYHGSWQDPSSDVTDTIKGLNPNTTYYIKTRAQTSSGTYYSNIVSFITPGTVIATISVSNITSNAVHVHGTASITDSSTIIMTDFSYGLGTSVATTISGNASTDVSADITGLNSEMQYSVRVRVQTSSGTYYSDIVTFTTLKNTTNPVNIVMIPVPAVTVYMQKRNVSLSNYSIAQTETTYAVWSAVYSWAIGHGYTFANAGRSGSNYGSPNQPVTMISWRDMIIWCNALSEMNGLTPVYYSDAGFTTVLKTVDASQTLTSAPGTEDNPFVNWKTTGYRLPTEAEWEYAGRYASPGNLIDELYLAGAAGDYLNKAACDAVAVYGIYYNTSSSSGYSPTGVTSTADVMSKNKNALGLFDMSGNVSEFCWDWYDPNLGTAVRHDETNPHGLSAYYIDSPGSYGYPQRYLMGGSYESVTYGCLPSICYSHSNNPSNRDFAGFRVAMSGQ
jgi:formylglycine-generating enzyme